MISPLQTGSHKDSNCTTWSPAVWRLHAWWKHLNMSLSLSHTQFIWCCGCHIFTSTIANQRLQQILSVNMKVTNGNWSNASCLLKAAPEQIPVSWPPTCCSLVGQVTPPQWLWSNISSTDCWVCNILLLTEWKQSSERMNSQPIRVQNS